MTACHICCIVKWTILLSALLMTVIHHFAIIKEVFILLLERMKTYDVKQRVTLKKIKNTMMISSVFSKVCINI